MCCIDVGGCLQYLESNLESINFSDLDAVTSIIKEAANKFDVPYNQFMAVTRTALAGQKVVKCYCT